MKCSTLLVLLFFLHKAFSSDSYQLCSSLPNNVTLQLCKKSQIYPKDSLPILVQPMIYVHEILALNENANSLTVSMHMRLSWNDTNISVKGGDVEQLLIQSCDSAFCNWVPVNAKSYDESKDLFFPKLKFAFQRENKKLQLFGQFANHYQSFRFFPPHLLEYAEFLEVTVSCTLVPISYPFDHHECNLTFYDPHKVTRILTFSPVLLVDIIDGVYTSGKSMDKLHSALPFDIKAEIIQPFKFPSHPTNPDFINSITGISFKFKRNSLGALISGYFIPTLVYSLASLISFAIPKEQVPGRLALLLTLFLITINTYNSQDLPNDRGLSYIEIWMHGTSLPILFALIEFGIILLLGKFYDCTSDMKKLDKITFVTILIFHLIFQFAFWSSVFEFMM